jgi:deoxyadenosine/deoxycytidine kinase
MQDVLQVHHEGADACVAEDRDARAAIQGPQGPASRTRLNPHLERLQRVSHHGPGQAGHHGGLDALAVLVVDRSHIRLCLSTSSLLLWIIKWGQKYTGLYIMSPTLRVSIDGSIGAGKTSAICGAVAPYGIPFHLEPVEQWEFLLKKMYEDPQRWAMTFNVSVLLTMNRLAEQQQQEVVVHERSPLSCRYVFSELQHEMGFMTDEEMAIVDDAFQQTSWVPDVLLYIRTSPEVAFARMRGRDRECEESVDMRYLRRLHLKYEQFIQRIILGLPDTRVFVIDGDKEADQVMGAIRSALRTCNILPSEKTEDHGNT